MNNNLLKLNKALGFGLLLCGMLVFLNSCDFAFDLPEAGSIDDATLPSADFSFSQTDPEDFRIVTFTNESNSATEFSWDFGTGDSSPEKNPIYTFQAGEGTYTVSLSVGDANGESASITKNIEIIEPPEPDAINPTVINGDFSNGQDDWKISSFTGGTTSPFNSSSDGSSIDYDGNDTGSKTAGAKWTQGTSAGVYLSESSRFAYQAFTVSANTSYTVEWEHAIKNDKEDAEGGDRLVLQILDGHYSDGKDALTAPIIVESVGDQANGKGNFTLLKATFDSNDSGQIAIWIWGVTNEDAYADNIKLYPTE